MKYKRILLKLSGESLQGREQYGLSPAVLQSYAEQIRDVFQTYDIGNAVASFPF